MLRPLAQGAGLLLLGFLGIPTWAETTGAPDRMCDPNTNVCFCTGGWDGPDCTAMIPHCEDGFWRACTDDGDICTCTMKPLALDLPSEAVPDTPAQGQRSQ